ncbi:GIY-YIG nuclease family protein [Kaistia adipata]|uniref:GIY-YIG nuclease family protein n=1 Tax=Kaistia adipata TaxID=166954 RepID=UPI0003FA0054|nr:GIY-YIG nuclease family protein [Kaistia adipata]
MDTISAICLDALVILLVTPVPWIAVTLRFRRHCAESRDLEARLNLALAEVETVASKLRREGRGGEGRGPARRSARAPALAEVTRSGYVYVVSNIGSFGSRDVVKIGLTRRLDPADRVRELGDASVPFAFELHAVIYSDDAPALERALHNAFDRVRVNTRNCRKEFFRASLEDVERAVRRLAPGAVFLRDVSTVDYREARLRRQQTLARVAAATKVAARFKAMKPVDIRLDNGSNADRLGGASY